MNVSDFNVADFLLASNDPARPALITLERTYAHGELAAAVALISSYLRELSGVSADRVLLAGENSFFWVAAYLGTLRAGLISVPVPAGASAEEAAEIADSAGAGFAFVDASFARRHGRLFEGCHLITDRYLPPVMSALSQRTFGELVSEGPKWPAPSPRTRGDDLAALMFTSGSTGKPRGVMVSHANIVANTLSIIEYLELTPADRMMCVLPLHYCFGASLLHTHLRAGGSLVFDSRFMYPEVVLERMIDTGCTGFAGVPSHFQILLRHSALRQKHFPSLRHVQQAGGRLPPEMVSELAESLPGTRVFIMYGQTEATARLSYLPPEMLRSKLGSIGKGIPGVRLRVVNESGGPVGPGETGEIVAEGANVTHGYWRAPEETAAVFHEGRLHTGDLGRVDEDGYLYVVGRAKDFLKCGGKRIACSRIEDEVLSCKEVLEAAVVAMPDDILGDAVRLFLVPREGTPPGIAARIRSFCQEHLPFPLVPKDISVLTALPKNSAGKIVKSALPALALISDSAGGRTPDTLPTAARQTGGPA